MTYKPYREKAHSQALFLAALESPTLFYIHDTMFIMTSMLSKNKHKVLCKVWLEYAGEPLIGKGGAKILETIKDVKSISKAAKKAEMSYRYVWNYLAKLEKRLGEPVINTYKGGNKGGGGATLTELGQRLLDEYHRASCYMSEIVGDETKWEDIGLKISARNKVEGKVEQVDTGIITAKVRIKIETPTVITAIISKEAVEELDIKDGDHVYAVIKATEVMVAKDHP